MYIKNRYISIAYKLIIAVCGIIGIQMQLSSFTGSTNWGMLRFFTNLSNLACVLYFLAAAVWLITEKRQYRTTFCPILKGIVTMSIVVTMLVAQFMLHNFNMNGTMGTALTLLHCVVPLMTVFDWLLFDKKGQITRLTPIFGLIAPLVYFACAVICAQSEELTENGSRYPYSFIDIDKLGIFKVSITVVLLVVGFTALGYLLFAIDHGLEHHFENHVGPENKQDDISTSGKNGKHIITNKE